nr:hypothetical protein GCM10020093_095650 [Planobispora longispora]
MVVAAVGRRGGAAHGEAQVVGPGEAFGVLDPVPETEGLLEVAVGLRGRAEPLGPAPGLDRGGQRPGEVVAGQVVVGELRRGALAGGQQPGELGVQAGPLAGQQVGVDGLLEQRVPEGVAVLAGGMQQAPGDDLPHGLLEGHVVQARGLLQEGVVDPPSRDGRAAQHPLGGVGEQLGPGEQQAGQAVGHRGAAERGLQQFLGVEGVALGAVDDLGDHPGVGAAERGDVVGHLLAVERAQFDGGDQGRRLSSARTLRSGWRRCRSSVR